MIDGAQAQVTSWQKWLFGIGILTTLLIFGIFSALTLQQLEEVHKSIDNSPKLQDSVLRAQFAKNAANVSQSTYNSLVLLENETIQLRYHNGNMLLEAQLYIKFLGMLSGMILAFLGAIFIFGKFREYPFKLGVKGGTGGGPSVSSQLLSTSPGLALAVIGMTIMLVTIINKNPLTLTDRPTYIQAEVGQAADTTKKTGTGSQPAIPSTFGNKHQ